MKRLGSPKLIGIFLLVAHFSANNAAARDGEAESYIHDREFDSIVEDYYQKNRTHAFRPSENGGRRVIRAMIATGFNDVLGRPAFDLRSPFGLFGFTSMGIYNDGAERPLHLSMYNNGNDIVSTSIDEKFLGLAGKTLDDVDPSLLNVPIRDVPVNTDFAFVERTPLAAEMEAAPLEVSQAEPANTITLDKWMQASGYAIIDCKEDSTAELSIRTKDLIPNRMYGVWATLGGDFLSSFPIGGTPNMFVTDENGDGQLKRNLNFCPLDVNSAPRPVLVINIVYYSSHQNFGAVPEPVFVDGFWLGTVTHNHLQIPINVDLLAN